jgi:hypothetical protein
MTIQDDFLKNIADGLSSGSIKIPAYLAYSTSTAVPLLSDTTLVGEVGDRTAFEVESPPDVFSKTWSTINSGATVPTAGIEYGSVAVMTKLESTDADNLMCSAITVPTITHTTSFDIESTITYTVGRL